MNGNPWLAIPPPGEYLGSDRKQVRTSGIPAAENAGTTLDEKGRTMKRQQVRSGYDRRRGSLALAVIASAATPEDQKLLAELKNYPYRIVHESYRDNHWVLVVRNADGSNPVTLTRPGDNENYPHVSPDGKKITFEFEEGKGKAKRRNVYFMNIDGSGRTRVAEAGRDPCWTPDGKAIVYLKDEVDELQYKDFATKGLFLYDLATGKTEQHVNHDLYHLYNVCCTPDGNWFVSTVHAGMGCGHGILAIEAHGQGVYNLDIPGCRPDISPDGKKIAWGADDTRSPRRRLRSRGRKAESDPRPRRGDEREPDPHLSHRLVAGQPLRGFFSRADQGFRAGDGPGSRRHQGRGLEHLRGRRRQDQPLGGHHQRRQVEQGAGLVSGGKMNAWRDRQE